MGNYKKRHLLESIQLMEEANRTVQNLGKKDPSAATDILIQCQEMAQELGNHLEEEGETGKELVAVLEVYCEELYRQSLVLGNENQSRKLGKKIKKQLIQLSNSIQRDWPEDKKEIVFLPYKASMWDSLESIWKAAREDEAYESYVIPIPYFEKKEDGSLGQMVWEGNQYPDYVPITDWREYHIEERKPEFVYIHNPYDNWNLVTTVHPLFYASELKKHTEMLIYIPYFIGIDDQVKEHFCIAPGILHADRVIVESEQVREIYIDAFHRFEKENECIGLCGNLQEKVLALGSPKLDRVTAITKKAAETPKDWERLIVRSDGTRKQVILYNTTIGALLKNGKAALEQIRTVINLFQENRDMVLLWRPHPLLLSTVKAMRSELYETVMQLTEQYRREGWGIYDDTADVERAIALSDAYYGDWSSLVTLYQRTGKPIMIDEYSDR